MLFPKKVKHRKWHKGRSRRTGHLATSRARVSFGDFGLRSQGEAWVTARQIEAARRAIARYVKRGGKLWIRIFPDKPITFHGNENTMGGGKGAVDHYVANVRPGTVLLEIAGIDEKTARDAFRLAGYKFGIKTAFVKKSAV